MPDFRVEAQYSSLREAREARDRHIEVTELIESLRQHTWVPMTFDADIPELAFGKWATSTSNWLQVPNNKLRRDTDGSQVAFSTRSKTKQESVWNLRGRYGRKRFRGVSAH